mgnify:CR=1 FL=1
MKNIKLIIILILYLLAAASLYVYQSNKEVVFKATAQATILGDDYEEAEKELFALQTSTSTQAFHEKVFELSEIAAAIHMNGCSPDPVSLQARRGESVEFVNISDKSLKLNFKGEMFILEPQGTATTKPLTLGKRYLERMVITYLCEVDGYQSRAGFVYVSP